MIDVFAINSYTAKYLYFITYKHNLSGKRNNNLAFPTTNVYK